MISNGAGLLLTRHARSNSKDSADRNLAALLLRSIHWNSYAQGKSAPDSLAERRAPFRRACLCVSEIENLVLVVFRSWRVRREIQVIATAYFSLGAFSTDTILFGKWRNWGKARMLIWRSRTAPVWSANKKLRIWSDDFRIARNPNDWRVLAFYEGTVGARMRS